MLTTMMIKHDDDTVFQRPNKKQTLRSNSSNNNPVQATIIHYSLGILWFHVVDNTMLWPTVALCYCISKRTSSPKSSTKKDDLCRLEVQQTEDQQKRAR